MTTAAKDFHAPAAEDWRSLPADDVLFKQTWWRKKSSVRKFKFWHKEGAQFYDYDPICGRFNYDRAVIVRSYGNEWQPCDAEGRLLPWDSLAVAAKPESPAVAPAAAVGLPEDLAAVQRFLDGNDEGPVRMPPDLTDAWHAKWGCMRGIAETCRNGWLCRRDGEVCASAWRTADERKPPHFSWRTDEVAAATARLPALIVQVAAARAAAAVAVPSPPQEIDVLRRALRVFRGEEAGPVVLPRSVGDAWVAARSADEPGLVELKYENGRPQARICVGDNKGAWWNTPTDAPEHRLCVATRELGGRIEVAEAAIIATTTMAEATKQALPAVTAEVEQVRQTFGPDQLAALLPPRLYDVLAVGKGAHGRWLVRFRSLSASSILSLDDKQIPRNVVLQRLTDDGTLVIQGSADVDADLEGWREPPAWRGGRDCDLVIRKLALSPPASAQKMTWLRRDGEVFPRSAPYDQLNAGEVDAAEWRLLDGEACVRWDDPRLAEAEEEHEEVEETTMKQNTAEDYRPLPPTEVLLSQPRWRRKMGDGVIRTYKFWRRGSDIVFDYEPFNASGRESGAIAAILQDVRQYPQQNAWQPCAADGSLLPWPPEFRPGLPPASAVQAHGGLWRSLNADGSGDTYGLRVEGGQIEIQLNVPLGQWFTDSVVKLVSGRWSNSKWNEASWAPVRPDGSGAPWPTVPAAPESLPEVKQVCAQVAEVAHEHVRQQLAQPAGMTVDGHGVIRVELCPPATMAFSTQITVPSIFKETTMPAPTTTPTTAAAPTPATRARRAYDEAKRRAPVEWTLDELHKVLVAWAGSTVKDKRERGVIQRWVGERLSSNLGKAALGALLASPVGVPLIGSVLEKRAELCNHIADEFATRSLVIVGVEGLSLAKTVITKHIPRGFRKLAEVAFDRFERAHAAESQQGQQLLGTGAVASVDFAGALPTVATR